MNPTAISLAQASFQAALSSGTSTAPVALSQLLVQLSSDSQLQAFDTEAVGHSVGDEFPFLRNMISTGTPPDSAASVAWEAGVRWVLSALRNWDSNEVNSLNKLRALLSAITALDAKSAGLSSVAAQVASNQLTAGLQRVIESSDVGPGFNERGFPELRQQVESLANSGNLEKLWRMVPHMNFFPAPDFWTAVVLMYSADPAALAGIIERRNDAFFSLMICTVLGAQAIALASRVNNLVFKFVSVANFWQDRTAGPLQSSQSTLQALLLQVAQTSTADWAAWMQALFKYPNNSSLNVALAAVLHQLSQDHWTAFFKALSLSYSHRAAAPVANILIQFSRSASEVMWLTAYQIWSDWSYGQHESDGAMFAPVACALDFPVAMYYASLSSDVRLAEESRLLDAIETVEQQWFDSVTDLITERNRLKSRLRLVQHGIALANGSTQALPPPIQPDADLYARTRYHYHDVNII
jgi:hypothetical protein